MTNTLFIFCSLLLVFCQLSSSIILPSHRFANCRCGKKKESINLSTRVIGGGPAEPNEFPWAALLYIKVGGDKLLCGGTLVSDRFVVTAAHCLDHDQTNEIEVRLGEHNRKEKFETDAFITKAKISSFRLHPGYKNLLNIENKGYVENDIAALELETPVDFTAYPHIRPACLPEEEEIDQPFPDNQVGTVVGWGFTRIIRYTSEGLGMVDTRSHSDELNKLEDVRLINKKECDRIYEENLDRVKVRSGSICGLSQIGDSCKGDSGSGLVYRNPRTENFEVVGVVSYGAGCNSTFNDVKLPGVYTNTRDMAIHNFIQITIQESVFCLTSADQTPAPAPTPAPTWGAWEAWSICRPKNGFPRGQKSRERMCEDKTGEACGRLIDFQQRPCK